MFSRNWLPPTVFTLKRFEFNSQNKRSLKRLSRGADDRFVMTDSKIKQFYTPLWQIFRLYVGNRRRHCIQVMSQRWERSLFYSNSDFLRQLITAGFSRRSIAMFMIDVTIILLILHTNSSLCKLFGVKMSKQWCGVVEVIETLPPLSLLRGEQ